MKQRRNMLLVLGILIVLVIIYLSLDQWNKSKEKERAEEEKKSTIQLVDATSLKKLEYTDGETTMSFVKEDDTWYLEDDKETTLSQDAIDEITDAVKNLTAKRELKDPDEMSDYGLENPVYTVWYTEDDETHAIYIGDVTGEDYYVTIDDTKKVYTINNDLVYSLNFNLTELVENTDTEEEG